MITHTKISSLFLLLKLIMSLEVLKLSFKFMCHTYLVGYLLGRKVAKAYNILLLPIEYNKHVAISHFEKNCD